MGKLEGKVAIVSGAARGLGRAYPRPLADLGAKVAVADLNLRSYEEFEAEAKDMTADSTVAEIEAAGGTALGVEVDVMDHVAVTAMVTRVVQEWGRVVMSWSQMPASVGVGPGHEGQQPRSGALAACRLDESVRYRLQRQCGRPGHEGAAIREDNHGEFGRRDPAISGRNRDRSELVALRRLGTVEDCAKVVEFQATDLSDYVSGAVIPIDGGLVRR